MVDVERVRQRVETSICMVVLNGWKIAWVHINIQLPEFLTKQILNGIPVSTIFFSLSARWMFGPLMVVEYSMKSLHNLCVQGTTYHVVHPILGAKSTLNWYISDPTLSHSAQNFLNPQLIQSPKTELAQINPYCKNLMNLGIAIAPRKVMPN